jgi:hypothetical protein
VLEVGARKGRKRGFFVGFFARMRHGCQCSAWPGRAGRRLAGYAAVGCSVVWAEIDNLVR